MKTKRPIQGGTRRWNTGFDSDDPGAPEERGTVRSAAGPHIRTHRNPQKRSIFQALYEEACTLTTLCDPHHSTGDGAITRLRSELARLYKVRVRLRDMLEYIESAIARVKGRLEKEEAKLEKGARRNGGGDA